MTRMSNILDFTATRDDGGVSSDVQNSSEITTINAQFFYRTDALPATEPTVLKH